MMEARNSSRLSEAARKLREIGVSDEQLAATGLLNIAGK
jgi:hypothetical protein